VTLRPSAIRERLRKLREILTNLRELRKVPREEFVASYRHYWLAERGLHLAAEAVFDAGNHILSGSFNAHPSDYEDVVEKLAVHKVISWDLRERLRGLGGFRNILVHAYLDIDEGRVYETLRDELEAFELLARDLEAFLEEDTETG
jgi:uncharacterized protein YutE (UPF0331/DUF86 family)